MAERDAAVGSLKGMRMGEAPAIIGTASSYGEMLDCLRARANSLGISRETIDAIAGLARGWPPRFWGPYRFAVWVR